MHPDISARSQQLAQATATTARERLLGGTASVPGVHESPSLAPASQVEKSAVGTTPRASGGAKKRPGPNSGERSGAATSGGQPADLECTFAPEINAVSQRLAATQRRQSRVGRRPGHGRRAGTRVSSPAIVARLHEQGALKENRLHQQRVAEADRELEGCTFKPQITAVSRQLQHGAGGGGGGLSLIHI